MEKNLKNSRMTWTQLKDWVGSCKSSSPRQLKDADGNILNSPRKIAKRLITYFDSKVRRIRQHLRGKGDPLRTLRHLGVKKNQLKLRLVNKEEIIKEVRKMKPSKSLGPNNLQADLLKHSMKYTAE